MQNCTVSPAELASIANALNDVSTRLDDAAAAYRDNSREDVANDLIEVEKAVALAARRLQRLERSLR